MTDKFLPLLPGRNHGDNRDRLSNAAYIKSVIELIRLKEKYQQLDGMSQDPQLALAQVLFRKVAEESCQWVSNTYSYRNYTYSVVIITYIASLLLTI